MTTDKLDALAKGLSEAQRRALLPFTPRYSWHVHEPIASELVALGLLNGTGRIVHPSQRGLPLEYIITPLGLAVRARLLGKECG